MVVNQLRSPLSDAETDRIFQALADATRREIAARVTAGEYSVSGLAALYTMSFAAVQKHVAVLERASLVTKEKRGKGSRSCGETMKDYRKPAICWTNLN